MNQEQKNKKSPERGFKLLTEGDKTIAKTVVEKFQRLEKINPEIRKLAELFDLVIKH